MNRGCRVRLPGWRLLVALLAALWVLQASRSEAAIADAPSALATIQAAHFAEPLVPTKPTDAAEDMALAQALQDYQRRNQIDDFSALTGFLAAHPKSGWATALQTNLGLSYLHYGYFSKAMAAWENAWSLGRTSADPQAKLLVDRAVGELARLYSAVGQFDKVATLFEQIGTRPIEGSATEPIQEAREQLILVTKDPRHLFNCGPVALKLLILAMDSKDQRGNFLQWYRAGPKGTNLAELGGLAQKAGLSYQIVSRLPGQEVPLPAVVHWKVGHFSAILEKANGRYRVEEPGFPGSSRWVTQAALDSESSGYFLIPTRLLGRPDWRTIATTEAGRIWGKGPTNGVLPGRAGDPGIKPPNGCPMCGYDVKQAAVSVSLSDLPVGYTPPIGPAPKVRITYNQREDSQPAIFTFFNVGPKWALDWMTYVIDDPTNPGANVSRYLSGGGAYYYSGYNSSNGQFARQSTDGSILVLASQSPVTYRRQLGDGSVEIYAHSDGSSSYPRKVFLSQVIDPQGNAITLSYDGQNRLTTLTDATARQTIFSYTVAGKPLLVSAITDPFGRSATFGYDGSGRLTSITDILGLTSSFTYDANSLVNSLTTPYGTTTFAYTAPGAPGPPRYVEVTDALGYHERVEWLEPAPVPDSEPAATVPQGMPLAPTNQYLSYRDTFYWNKHAYVLAACTPSGGCDYSKARSTHFLHAPGTAIKSTTIESVKDPLENRIWYNYPGQTSSIFTGTLSMPVAVGRVLDDGTTQLSRYAYDTAGYFKLTQAIDPLGRTTTYTYSNQVDLAAISQTTQYGVQTTLAQFTYDHRHLPILVTDAAGQTSRLAYNAAGQLASATDALNHTTTYSYDTSGRLSSITNANSVTAATYTYDAFDRVATFTDSQGWTVGYSYDAANRVTRVSYPDGTAETFVYDKLDLVASRDRLQRTWTFTYDANRRLTAETDPAGKQTLFGYNRTGQVATRTDPKGFVTTWEYDLQGRPTKQIYADTSAVSIAYENTTSRVKTITDALGQIRQLGYAKDDLPLSLTYLNAVNPTPNVSFAYDPYFARAVSRTDGTGTTQYSYVPVGSPGALAVQQETTPISGGTIAYAYDALGRVVSSTVGGSGAETFQYDALGRLSTHGSDLGSFTFSYLGQTGQITQRQLASSTLATNWSYLPNSGDRRLASVGSVGLSSSNQTTFAYTSNADGFTTQVTQTSDATIPYPGTLTQAASYNNLNQLTNLSGQARTYDLNGNLLSDGTRTYSWDAEDRLIGISYPGQPGKATGFTYDGLGRRVAIGSTPPGGGTATTTNYLWCGFDICQARNAGNSVTRAYYAEGEFAPGAPGTPNYYGFDQLGSVRRVYTAGQAPSFDYDPYGNPLQATTPLTDFNYAGMLYNADSGLHLATFRAYDPVTGRFLSRDPLGEGTDPAGNLYPYVGGNPIDLVDPEGLNPLAIPVAFCFRFPRACLAGAGAGFCYLFPNLCFPSGPPGPGPSGSPPSPIPHAPPSSPGRPADCPPDYGVPPPPTRLPDPEPLIWPDPDAPFPPYVTQDADPSTPTGRRGNPMDVPRGTNADTTIGGRDYGGHAVDQMQGRGIPPSAVEEAIRRGQPSSDPIPGRTRHYDPANDLTVVTGPNGTVVTVVHGKR